MKSAMPFRGVAKPGREALVRELVAARPVPPADELGAAVRELWDGAEFREERYVALTLTGHRRWAPALGAAAGRVVGAALPALDRDGCVVGHRVGHHGTDEIAARRIGPLLRADPAALIPLLRTWARDPDRWLRRTAVIAQLGSAERTDLELLTDAIEADLDDPEFFLRKGVGWALRQHARTDPGWVRAFVTAHPTLSPLSRKEALKHL